MIDACLSLFWGDGERRTTGVAYTSVSPCRHRQRPSLSRAPDDGVGDFIPLDAPPSRLRAFDGADKLVEFGLHCRTVTVLAVLDEEHREGGCQQIESLKKNE